MTTTSIIRAIVATTAVVVALGVAGCGGSESEPHPEGSDTHVHIDPLDPDTLPPEKVAETAMNAILSWQPAADTSKADAVRRARPWLGGDLAAQAATPAPAPTGMRPDAKWEAWSRSKDSLTAACTVADDTPAHPDGMRTVIVDVRCRQTVLHTTGSSTTLAAERWRTTVTATDDGWRLTDFRFRS